MEAVRKVGKDGAQHRGDHAVYEDGEDSGEDEHAGWSFQGTSYECGKQREL